MAFCKVCICGEKIVFERRLSFPDYCPSCGRKLVDFMTYSEDDPRVEQLIREYRAGAGADASPDIQGNCNAGTSTENSAFNTSADYSSFTEAGNHKKSYYLKLSNGSEITIPEEGCIIGRTEVGAEELAEFPSVSRQHIRVIQRRNIGILIEDISSYGTLVDGQRIVKNTPVRVADGSKITLCNLDTTLMVKGDS